MSELQDEVLHFVEKILKDLAYGNPEIRINAVSSGGSNFTSALYYVTVTNPGKETLQMFAKISTMSDQIRDTFQGQLLYENEHRVYTKVLTAYNELQDKYGVPKEKRFISPKYYGSKLQNGKEIFVFENLDARGYKIIDRFAALTLQNVLDVISNLAMFHALGFGLEKEYPQIIEEYKPVNEGLSLVFQNLFHDFNIDDFVKNMDEDYKIRVKAFLKKKENNDLTKFHHPFGRKILVHGDYRSSNILFKERNNGRWSVMPVDYQTVRVGCGVSDLLYFIICSTDEQLRKNHFKHLLDHYYTELSQGLRWLGIDVKDVYARQQYDLELKEKLRMSLPVALHVIPIMLVSADAAPQTAAAGTDVNDFLVAPTADALDRIEGYIRDLARMGVI